MGLIDVIEQLNGFGFFTALLIFCLCVLGIMFAIKMFKEAGGLFGKSHRQLMDEEVERRLLELETRATNLEASAKKFNEDRIHDREQSHEYQNEYMEIVQAITEKQDAILNRVDAMDERVRKYQLADMRETLLQAYRYYTNENTNGLLMWTEIECHAWNEQYEVYKQNGGNSHMQDKVKPEMDKLRVIYLDDYDGMAELMESRSKNCN